MVLRTGPEFGTVAAKMGMREFIQQRLRVLAAVDAAIGDVLQKEQLEPDDLTAIGIAVPGVVEPDEARVVVTPNMSLSGVAIGPHLDQSQANVHQPLQPQAQGVGQHSFQRH